MKSTSRMISISFTCISLLILLYIFYKAYFVYENNKNDYYLKYYFFSISLLFLSILSFRLTKEIKQNLSITIVVIVIMFYIFEAVLNSNLIKKFYSKIFYSIDYDVRTKLEVYKDLKKNNSDITITAVPADLLRASKNFLPLSGISNFTTINCNESGYYSIYESDDYGFNNPQNVWSNKNKKTIVLGDSFVHGSCVNRPFDISSQLRKKMKDKTTLINLGYNGNGPLLQYATLREYLPYIEANKVIFFYYEGNDIVNLKEEIKSDLLKKYILDQTFHQNLFYKQFKVNKNFESYFKKKIKDLQNFDKNKIQKIKDFLKLKKLRTITIETVALIYSKSTKSAEDLPSEFRQILKLARNLSHQNESEFYFVYLPTYYRYVISDYDNNYFKIKKIIEELNIKFIDVHKDVFLKNEEPLSFFPFKKPGHYTKLGYKKIADFLFDEIYN